MKRNILFISLVICSLQSISQITHFQKFSISDFIMFDTLCPDNQIYTYFPDFYDATLMKSGQPALPLVPVKLLIPTGSKIDSIVIHVGDTTSITLGHRVFPYQPPIPSFSNCPEPIFSSIDSAVYYNDNGFPSEDFSINYGLWYKAQIVTIYLSPIKYFPIENKLVLYDAMTLNVYFTEGGNDETQQVKMESEFYSNFIESLASIIDNPEVIDNYLRDIKVIESKETSTLTDPNMDYVVIVPDNFLNSTPISTFINWKKRKGIDIGVVSLNEIYSYVASHNISVDNIGNDSPDFLNSQNINDNAAKIRMYLKQVNNNGGSKYVLLVGDENSIPVRKYYAEHGNFPNTTPSYAITDKYFADYNSDYAVDGDTKWGEISPSLVSSIGDKVDFYPEAYVGRIPCANIEEFGIWVNKVMSFETNPGNGDASYLARFVMTTADGLQNSIWSSTYTNLNIFNPLTIFKELPTYNSEYPTAPYGSDIIASLNTSPSGWWTWDNHGSPSYFVTMSHCDNGSTISCINSSSNGLLALHNENKYGIVSSNCCDIANFEVVDNMVDASIFNNSGGSVALAGNTDLGWYPTGQNKLNTLSSIIRDCHFGDNHTQTSYCTADWDWFHNKNSHDYAYYETYLTNNYFGDPEMNYYTKEPVRIIADVSPRHIGIDVANTIEVSIKNLQYHQKVTICLYQSSNSGSDFQVIQEAEGVLHGDVVVSFNISVNTLATGKLFVTVSGFNLLPFTDEIIVSPGCGKSSNIELITSTPAFPWIGILYKNHDVVVKPGATLTIIGTVYFVPEAKLIVEPGAKLILDGGILGTACESLWQGVEVWGQYNQLQLSNYQGEVYVINGGLIKDAIYGIKTFKGTFNGYDVYNTGGIIRCTNAEFLNNKIAISYHPYAYNNIPNTGYYSDCNFTWDDNYILPSNPALSDYPNSMVSLRSINNLNFTRCKFKNEMITDQFDEKRGYAFSTNNASFTVKGNENTYNLSSIEGFYYGIKCVSVNPRIAYVKNTTFKNNLRGVYCGTGDLLVLLNRNKFYTHTGTIAYPASGIYLDNATGYSVQENVFEGNYIGGASTYETGIVVNNSGMAPNEIYNNSFNKLQNGITAQDMNRSFDGITGLVCKCNDFTGIKTDESVLLSSQNPTWGIALYQGDSLSVTGPAGNTFSLRTSSNGDLTNNGTRLKYYHHRYVEGEVPRVKPLYYNNLTIRPTNFIYTKTEACPSKIGGSGTINSDELKAELLNLYDTIAQKETELVTLIDGGNTVEITEIVAYSLPTEAVELRDELIEKSPYLSDTVMKAAINKENVLPNVMIRDILTANPQSATSESVLNELDKRIDPMPDVMYNQILDGEIIISPLESMEMKLASLKSIRKMLFNQLVSYYLADTTGTLSDTLNLLLAREHAIEVKYLLASLQLLEGDTIASRSTLALIPQTINFTMYQQELYDDYIAWFEILKEMNSDTIPDYLPDSIQIVSLTDLMIQAHEPVKSYVRYILMSAGVITYTEPYLFADELKKDKIKRDINPDHYQTESQMYLKPNPCSEYVIISYNLCDPNTDNVMLEINTVQGANLRSYRLSIAQDNFILPLIGFNSGIYVVSLKSNGKIVESQKIIIVK